MHLNPSACVERVCLSDFVFFLETFVVEFVPGFARVRCVIANGESGVIIYDLTLDQVFTCTRRKCPTVCPASMFSLGLYGLTWSFPMHYIALILTPFVLCTFFPLQVSVLQPDCEILGLPLVIKQREFLTAAID